MSGPYTTIDMERGPSGLAAVTLDRAEVRNAFNETLIAELHAAFAELAADDGIRAVVLRGRGPSFCAGADLNWMKAGAQLTHEENHRDAVRMAEMFETVASCPAPVIALVQGHAFGGGAGLVAAADVALVARDAQLGFTEVRLGIIPAVISPYVLRKIGQTHARRYFVTGEVFDGAEAERIGLAQKAVEGERLDAELARLVKALMHAGPVAAREAKRLVGVVDGLPRQDWTATCAPWIARLRGTEEGQEGMEAFLAKRKPSWTPGKA